MTTGILIGNSNSKNIKLSSRRAIGGNGTTNSNNNNNKNQTPSMGSPEFSARLFLFVACLWPLWVLALFGASAPGQIQQGPMPEVFDHNVAMSNAHFNLRNVLDRVDVMGYGPTHPRVAVVIVGEEKDLLISSVESVVSNTDLNRIFVICAVVDGHEEDRQFIKDLQNIDNGSKL
jgi:hypothetical protein